MEVDADGAKKITKVEYLSQFSGFGEANFISARGPCSAVRNRVQNGYEGGYSTEGIIAGLMDITYGTEAKVLQLVQNCEDVLGERIDLFADTDGPQ